MVMGRLKELARAGIKFCQGLDLEPYGERAVTPAAARRSWCMGAVPGRLILSSRGGSGWVALRARGLFRVSGSGPSNLKP